MTQRPTFLMKTWWMHLYFGWMCPGYIFINWDSGGVLLIHRKILRLYLSDFAFNGIWTSTEKKNPQMIIERKYRKLISIRNSQWLTQWRQDIWGNATPHTTSSFSLVSASQRVLKTGCCVKRALSLVQGRHLYILVAFEASPSAKEVLQLSYGTKELLWLPEGVLVVAVSIVEINKNK